MTPESRYYRRDRTTSTPGRESRQGQIRTCCSESLNSSRFTISTATSDPVASSATARRRRIHTHTQACAFHHNTRTSTCIQMCTMQTRTCSYIHTLISQHAYIHTITTYMHTHHHNIHTDTYTFVHIHKHAFIYIHMYTHTHTPHEMTNKRKIPWHDKGHMDAHESPVDPQQTRTILALVLLVGTLGEPSLWGMGTTT